MASERITIRMECPRCEQPFALPVRTPHESGRPTVAIDTSALRAHVAAHQAEDEASSHPAADRA